MPPHESPPRSQWLSYSDASKASRLPPAPGPRPPAPEASRLPPPAPYFRLFRLTQMVLHRYHVLLHDAIGQISIAVPDGLEQTPVIAHHPCPHFVRQLGACDGIANGIVDRAHHDRQHRVVT